MQASAYGLGSLAVATAVALLGGERSPADIADIRKRWPTTGLICCLTWTDPALRRLAALARSGVDDVVLLGDLDAERELRRIVAAYERHHLGPEWWPDDVLRQAGVAHRVVGWVMRRAHRKVTARAVAEWFGMDQGTVNRHLRRVGRLRLGEEIATARLMHVAKEFARSPVTAAAVGRALGFPSETALRMLVRRATGMGIIEFREGLLA